MKKETTTPLMDLKKAQERIERLERELRETHRVQEVIVAAGLLPQEKFYQARELVEKLD